ncbi:MAG TPA: DoxX family protein [Tepidisphaeraceae bacterium]|jgi:hypothetical protein|nr:DoxX family protein [Tepidisphaeraceae bacterium]
MNERSVRTIYRITTGVVCAVAAFSAVNFSLAHPIGPGNFGPGGAFTHLGLPRWFKLELTSAKILGVLAFLLPGVPRKAKEFAYFGFGLTFVSASIAHASSGDAIWLRLDPLIFFAVLLVSYLSFHRLRRASRVAGVS